MATLLDWGNVDAAAAQIEQALGLTDRREAFTLLALSSLLRIDFDEARGCITDGAEDIWASKMTLTEGYLILLSQMRLVCFGISTMASQLFVSASAISQVSRMHP